jgi:acetoin utilization deacetylase AcuC-like enzyme
MIHIYVDYDSLTYHNSLIPSPVPSGILDVPSRASILVDKIRSWELSFSRGSDTTTTTTAPPPQNIAIKATSYVCPLKNIRPHLSSFYYKNLTTLSKASTTPLFLDSDETTMLTSTSLQYARRSVGCLLAAGVSVVEGYNEMTRLRKWKRLHGGLHGDSDMLEKSVNVGYPVSTDFSDSLTKTEETIIPPPLGKKPKKNATKNDGSSLCLKSPPVPSGSIESLQEKGTGSGGGKPAALQLHPSIAFSVSRPPGHHNSCSPRLETSWNQSSGDKSSNWYYGCHGGCILPNIPIVVNTLMKKYDDVIKRVAIIDLDAHYGDGTTLYYDNDENVLTVSIHWDQTETTTDTKYFPFYEGAISSDVADDGTVPVSNVNIPMHTDSTDSDVYDKIKGIVIPALQTHKPDIIILAIGFDGLKEDTSSGLNYTPQGYGQMCAMIVKGAKEVNEDIPILCTLEGGYVPEGNADAFEAVVRELSGV